MKLKIAYLVFLFFLFLPYVSLAESIPEPEPEKEISNNESSPWEKFGFGAGVSYTIDTGQNDRVKSAEIVNGVVRVTDEENGIPRVILEGHYFFGNTGTLWGSELGYGPFIAIQPGENDIINAIALGFMCGFRDKGSNSNLSWNLGIGISADPNTQILGDGFKENQAPPEGETEIRYKEETQYGIMITFSASW